MMHGRRRLVFTLAPAMLGVSGFAAGAQERKPARIVILSRSALPEREVRAFRDGLRDLGHVEGRTFVIELRDAGGDARDNDARLRELAVEVARSRPEIIFASQGQAAQAAKAASSTIPIAFTATDPVAIGLVASLARPGGNLTGTGSSQLNLETKRLELLRDAFPALKRVAVLYVASPSGAAMFEAANAAAPILNFEVLPVLVRTEAEIGPAIVAAATQQRAEAILVTSSPMFRNRQSEMIALAARYRIPAIYEDGGFVEAGGLMSYGPDRLVLIRRVAGYVDRILKGAKPADLPIEQPDRFELMINLKTAAALGVTISPLLVALADRMIE